MPKEKPLLKIKVTAPDVRPGHIPVPLLLTICREAQTAVNRQAAALEGRRSQRPGPPTRNVSRECTLELISLKRGSTTLDFAPASGQPHLPGVQSVGAEAVIAVATALRSVGRSGGRWVPPDPGLLDALDKLGEIFDEGVTKLQWIVPAQNGGPRKVAEFVPESRPRIKARMQEALPFGATAPPSDGSTMEGTLELTEGRGRINPAIGPATPFTFGPDQAEIVYEARRKPVKVKVDPKTRKLKDIEITSPPKSLGEVSFFAAKTISQLVVEQGIQTIKNLEQLAGAIPDADVDQMVAEIYRDREA